MKVDVTYELGIIATGIQAICLKYDKDAKRLYLYQSMRKVIDNKPEVYDGVVEFVAYDDKE